MARKKKSAWDKDTENLADSNEKTVRKKRKYTRRKKIIKEKIGEEVTPVKSAPGPRKIKDVQQDISNSGAANLPEVILKYKNEKGEVTRVYTMSSITLHEARDTEIFGNEEPKKADSRKDRVYLSIEGPVLRIT